MSWNDIVNNKEFQAQPFETKQKVAENYFSKRIAVGDFVKQPKEVQDRVKANFMKTIGEPKTFTERVIPKGISDISTSGVLGPTKLEGEAPEVGSIGDEYSSMPTSMPKEDTTIKKAIAATQRGIADTAKAGTGFVKFLGEKPEAEANLRFFQEYVKKHPEDEVGKKALAQSMKDVDWNKTIDSALDNIAKNVEDYYTAKGAYNPDALPKGFIENLAFGLVQFAPQMITTYPLSGGGVASGLTQQAIKTLAKKFGPEVAERVGAFIPQLAAKYASGAVGGFTYGITTSQDPIESAKGFAEAEAMFYGLGYGLKVAANPARAKIDAIKRRYEAYKEEPRPIKPMEETLTKDIESAARLEEFRKKEEERKATRPKETTFEEIMTGEKEPLIEEGTVAKEESATPVSKVENLRPAVAFGGEAAGKASLIGKEGQTHDEVLTEKGWPTQVGDRGFVDPAGNFLNREQALEWTYKNQPEVAKEVPLRGGELHSKEYAETAGIRTEAEAPIKEKPQAEPIKAEEVALEKPAAEAKPKEPLTVEKVIDTFAEDREPTEAEIQELEDWTAKIIAEEATHSVDAEGKPARTGADVLRDAYTEKGIEVPETLKEKVSPVEAKVKAEKEEAPSAPRTFIEPKFGGTEVERPVEELAKDMARLQKELGKVKKTINLETASEEQLQKLDILEDQAKSVRNKIEKKDPSFFSKMLGSERGAVGDLSPAPAFYSQLEKVVESKVPNRAEAYVVKRIVENPQSGIKQDELKWTGLSDWLEKKGKEKVSKEEVLEFVKQGAVQVKEVVKGEGIGYPTKDEVADDLYQKRFDELDEDRQLDVISERDARIHGTRGATGYTQGIGPKFSQYKTPGGENYREVLLTLPTESPDLYDSTSKKMFGKEWNLLDTDQKNIVSREVINRPELEKESQKPTYQSPHWDEPNVLAHTRVQDFRDSEGKKVLLVEEVQSDWAQEGRKTGFVGNTEPVTAEEKLWYDVMNKPEAGSMDTWRLQDINRYNDIHDRIQGGAGTLGVPPMPFSKSWHELVMKRMLREAAEKGYDKIAWTTGEQQAERYDLSKQVEEVAVMQHENGTFSVQARPKGSDEFISAGAEVSADKLSDIIGKDLANKVAKDSRRGDLIAKGDPLLYSGVDLKVGGEGMKGFYDKILVDFMNKYTKKWGGKVESSDIVTGSGNAEYNIPYDIPLLPDSAADVFKKYKYGTPDADIQKIRMGLKVKGYKIETTESGHVTKVIGDKLTTREQKVHSISITPAMRSETVYKGQPLYMGVDPTQLPAALKTIKTEIFDPVKSFWARLPEQSDMQRIIGEYTGARQEFNKTLDDMLRAFDKEFPDTITQEAMSRYREAGGSEVTLKEQLADTKDEYLKKVYDRALKLTDKEKAIVEQVEQSFDEGFREAVKHGILAEDVYLENYFPHLGIEKPETSESVKKFMSEVNSGIMNTRPNFAKRRLFETLHDLEKAGYKQKHGASKIGYALVAWHKSLAEAIAARKAVTAMRKARTAEDKPALILGGGGRVLEANEINNTPETTIVTPNVRKGKDSKTGKEINFSEYKEISHPALRGYKWVSEDSFGNPILMEGKVLVHKDVFGKVNAILGRSWFDTYTTPKNIPFIGGKRPFVGAKKASAFVKGTLLSGGIFPVPFHQVAIAEHAIFHGVNPFNTPELNLSGAAERELLSHGILVYNKDALANYGEGVTSGGLPHWLGGVVKRLGERKLPEGHPLRYITDNADYMQRYGEWLFNDYIPRLKMAMAKAALGRAEKWYAKDLASGKITRDQLLDNVAKQANAAFGELNYEYIGRNKSLQDGFKLLLLAPDFLEARLKFAGQALRPYGREQQKAFLKGALITAVAAQTLNVMFGDKNEANWRKPFTFTIGGKDYTPRSVIGDVYHGVTDPRGFALYRLNPLYGRSAYEIGTGRDYQGRALEPNEIAKDIVKSWAPIPAQGFMKNSLGNTNYDEIMNGILASFSIQSYRSLTDMERAAYDLKRAKQPLGGYSKEQKESMAEKAERRKKFKSGELNEEDLTIDEIKSFTSDEDEVTKFKALTKQFSVHEMMRLWKEATPEEQEKYRDIFLQKVARANIVYEDKEKYFEMIEPTEARPTESRSTVDDNTVMY